MTLIKTPNDVTYKLACDIIRDGGLVAIPTETVYGLAADATNGEAVARIFAAKGRPQFNPLISHFAYVKDIENHAVITPLAREIMTHFCPGPLTLILKRKDTSTIHSLVTAGLDTVAVRVPAHNIAHEFLKQIGVPLAAPSANASGQLSPTTPHHVQQSLGDKVDLIIAGGKTEVGLESTVLDLSRDEPILLRLGAITKDDIEQVLGHEIQTSLSGENEKDVKSPGQLLKHYAPRKPLRLNVLTPEEGEGILTFGPDQFVRASMKLNLSEAGDLIEAASNLFDYLHRMDEAPCEKIAVMPIPENGIGAAINDRLKRAAEE